MTRMVNSLKFMYNMERFATQIYLTQHGSFTEEEIINKLKAAADNEQQHVDNLQKRILELRGTPSHLGFIFQTLGKMLGLVARIMGKLIILKTDIWIEKQAIKDYGNFLNRVKFDEESIALIERIILDEQRHVETWESSIKMLESKK